MLWLARRRVLWCGSDGVACVVWPQDAQDASGTAGTALGSRPPSQLSQQASSGYGSTRSRKDDVTLNQPSSEESSKLAGGRGSSPLGDASRTGVRRQNSESYGSMRSTSGRAKGPLARTAAYLSMRLPGAKRRARAKADEDSHQMIEAQPVAKAVPNREGQGQGQTQHPSGLPQTTQFTSETRHTVTSRPDLNTVTVEASQTSRLTVLATPQAAAEANNNSIYCDGGPRHRAPSRGTPTEHSSDPRAYDPAATGLPVPAPRNGASGRPRHTYQNLPPPAAAAQGGMGVQQASPHPPPQPVVCEVCCAVLLLFCSRGK